jgi:hypothetical protein
MPEGIKNDQEKVRTDLLPPEFCLAVSEILTFGAKKYADENWRAGISYKRVIGAVLRHLYTWMVGKDNDNESGKSHLWHAACNLCFLITYEEHRELYSKFDDRWKYEDIHKP